MLVSEFESPAADLVEDFMIQEMVDAAYDVENSLAIRVAACEWLLASDHPFNPRLRDELVARLVKEAEAYVDKIAKRVNGA